MFLGLAKECWKTNQLKTNGDFYAPPLGPSLVELVPNGVFVRVSGRNEKGDSTYYPSVHGELRTCVNSYFPRPCHFEDERIAIVDRGLSTDISARLSCKVGRYVVINTGATDMRTEDVFEVCAPDKDDLAAQSRMVSVGDSEASCGGAFYYPSMCKLAGGLLATQVVPRFMVDNLAHKATRDLDYLSSVDTNAAYSVPCAAIQHAMQVLNCAYKLRGIFDGDGGPNATAATITHFGDYLGNRLHSPPNLAEMKALVTRPELKTIMCEGMDSFIQYYKFLVSETCGQVICSFFNNPTSDGSTVYGASGGKNLTMSAVYAHMFKFNGTH